MNAAGFIVAEICRKDRRSGRGDRRGSECVCAARLLGLACSGTPLQRGGRVGATSGACAGRRLPPSKFGAVCLWPVMLLNVRLKQPMPHTSALLLCAACVWQTCAAASADMWPDRSALHGLARDGLTPCA